MNTSKFHKVNVFSDISPLIYLQLYTYDICIPLSKSYISLSNLFYVCGWMITELDPHIRR